MVARRSFHGALLYAIILCPFGGDDGNIQAADREIELFRQKREALVQQNKGLMQVLLTGKVRVNIAETRRDPEGVG